MLNFITRVPEGINIIRDPGLMFDSFVEYTGFGQLEDDIMWSIDSARLIDKNFGSIETPWGVTSVRDLSSGCKTVLLLVYMYSGISDIELERNIVDVTLCGLNALRYLINYANSLDYDIPVILNHTDGLFKLDGLCVKFNGVEYNSVLRGIRDNV